MLARLADTIADNPKMESSSRLATLEEFSTRLNKKWEPDKSLDLGNFLDSTVLGQLQRLLCASQFAHAHHRQHNQALEGRKNLM
jgi:hypothetical protein